MSDGVEASQTRWLVGLGLALALLVGVLAIQGEEPVVADPESTVPVWSVEASQVVGLRVERAEGAMRFRREGERWWMVEPVRSAADPDRLNAILQITEVERGLAVDAPEAPEEYGLGDPPRVRLVAELEGGLERHVDLGNTAPVGYRTYARGADGSVVAIAGDAQRLLSEPPELYRDHRMFDVDPAQVRAVTIWSPEGQLTMEGKGTQWRLVGFGRADPAQIDDVVMGLLDLRYDVIWDRAERVEAAEHGARLTLEDGTVHELRVGDVTPMGAVSSTSDGRFGTLYPEQLKQLGRGPTSIADPRAFPLDLEAADEVRVELDGWSFTALRQGPAWEAPGVRPDKVYRGVKALSEVPAVYRLTLPDAPSTGAGQLVVREGDELRVVSLGQLEEGFRVVEDVALGVAYRVPADALDTALSEWR